jgi:hypothetical protein
MKILVAGAAGFFGANIIRYFLYHSKDIDIVGVDNIPDVEKANLRLYHHRKHKFYLCDINSPEFDRIIELEKPDMIIDAIVSQHENDSKNLNTKMKLLEQKVNVISLISELSLIKNSLKSITDGKTKSVIQMPICFGFRENATKGLAKIIYGAMEDSLEGGFGIYNWLFIEEVIRKLLETIEKNDFTNKSFLGYELSEMEIANFCYSYISGQNPKVKVEEEFEGEEMSFSDSLKKTADWFKTNVWSKNIN